MSELKSRSIANYHHHLYNQGRRSLPAEAPFQPVLMLWLVSSRPDANRQGSHATSIGSHQYSGKPSEHWRLVIEIWGFRIECDIISPRNQMKDHMNMLQA